MRQARKAPGAEQPESGQTIQQRRQEGPKMEGIGLWFVAVWQLQSLQSTIEELPLPVYDSIVRANQTFLAPWEVNIIMPHEEYYSRLGNMFNAFQAVSIWTESVRLVIVLYIFVLMLKFFKSFKANKRLNVVINTLTHSVKDVSHFAIVFLTIFLCNSASKRPNL
eukprot:Skav212605  [mRNA]  locus=scaffold2176:112351:117051:- [translate_table: standard]